jgi:hypothetical protein
MDKNNQKQTYLVVQHDNDLTTTLSLEWHDENPILNVYRMDKPRKGKRKSGENNKETDVSRPLTRSKGACPQLCLGT